MNTVNRTSTVVKDLTRYEINPERGFLPSIDPLKALPRAFQAWDDIAQELPKLLVAERVRQAVDTMPLLDTKGLNSRPKKERAMMVLSYIGHAYVWGEPEPKDTLPSQLAIPWHALSVALGRPPVLSYASYALHNWKRIDSAGPVALGNIALLQNFLGGIDEEWFVLIHVDIEARAAGVLKSIAAAQNAAKVKDVGALENSLSDLAKGIEELYRSLDRMPEHCDPYIYFHRVRPYIHGWKNHPKLPNGVKYEGVDSYAGAPQRFRGETGAQSSIVPALDGALDVQHADDPLRGYLLEMKDYMPPKHRAFILACERGPSLRKAAQKAGTSVVKENYNQCVVGLEKFRGLHLEYAIRYIAKQAADSASNPSQVGTGGTPFVEYLRKHRDETGQHLLR